ncbi:MAG: pilus assembly protein MshP [Gammaproteobacteria bacterium]|nr:pilus assembly protein MshP [Gammaproteobacteria bacterium]
MSGLHRQQRRTAQRGFALLSALFILLVLAGLGVVAVRLAGVQHHSVSLALQAARAFAAAQSGIEYGAHRALVVGSCAPAAFAYTEGGLNGFNVNLTCTATSHAEGAGTTTVYALSAFAWSGTYGTPDYVSRRIQATVTDST